MVTADLEVGTSIAEAVLDLRRCATRVIVAPYLLAEDTAARRIRSLGQVSGADGTAAALGAHPLVVELVARRYLAALRHLHGVTAQTSAA